MKRLLYIFLGLSLILGCDENEDDKSFAVNAFEGLWSGSFLNQENGSWTFSVNQNRDLIGSLTSKEYNKIYSLEGVVDESGNFQATLFTSSVVGEVGEVTGQLDKDSIYGSYYNTFDDRGNDVIGRITTETESSIIDYWYYYSEKLDNGNDVTFYDHERYCSNLFMQFNDDGTFLDYYNLTSTGCSEIPYRGTWSVQKGYYELLYIEGGSNDLSQSDIYITYPDENTMRYKYINATYTYKRKL